ncbi:MAG TPA: DUF1800 domain-containing protein [Chitinophagaceae bacterium]|nr:DUF1800 domain-containing protein [Chitinophagaceae bacterium]HAN38221.1 DUF1800 domain-containing protein [Chitinophagaceae bacterium]
MAASLLQKNSHLLQRATFGIAANDIPQLNQKSTNDWWQQLVSNAATPPVYIDVASNIIKDVITAAKANLTVNDMARGNGERILTPEQRKQIRDQSREDLKQLNLTWLQQMVESKAQLREKMAFFWHNHFACREINSYYQQQLLHAIRTHALENFGDLLKAVSKSASMLSFLNNQQNRKAKPNENFAREVMELFTMGRGNYTEKDIKEAARAFTGWGFTLDGTFVFRKFFHDSGSKTILGKTGNFTGDDVLNMLLEHKQTAYYITEKIYKQFVHQNTDKKHIQWLAERFYKNNYAITPLLTDIFTSSWFYDTNNMAAQVKSPIELIVGMQRLLPMQVANPQVLLLLQRGLGQTLFFPPNVAGWPGGFAWIDSSSLMLRLRISQLMKDDDAFAIQTKQDDDVQMGMREQLQARIKNNSRNGFQLNANINWEAYIQRFDGVAREQLLAHIAQVVVPNQTALTKLSAVTNTLDSTTRNSYIQSATVALMATPEYQMC